MSGAPDTPAKDLRKRGPDFCTVLYGTMRAGGMGTAYRWDMPEPTPSTRRSRIRDQVTVRVVLLYGQPDARERRDRVASVLLGSGGGRHEVGGQPTESASPPATMGVPPDPPPVVSMGDQGAHPSLRGSSTSRACAAAAAGRMGPPPAIPGLGRP